jgi:hypothetical protein
MSFCFGISIFSSPFWANLTRPAERSICHPRYRELVEDGMGADSTYLLSESEQIRLVREEQKSHGVFQRQTLVSPLLAACDLVSSTSVRISTRR